MAILVIDEITDNDDLYAVIQYLLDRLHNQDSEDLYEPGTIRITRGPNEISDSQLAALVALHEDYTCQSPHHSNECSCRLDAANFDPRNPRLLEGPAVEGPPRYVRCIKTGTHTELTECWMCWSDVQRGVLTLGEVLVSA